MLALTIVLLSTNAGSITPAQDGMASVWTS